MGQEQIELVEVTSIRIPQALGLFYEQIKELANKDDEEAPYELLDVSFNKEAGNEEEEVTNEEMEESNEVSVPH